MSTTYGTRTCMHVSHGTHVTWLLMGSINFPFKESPGKNLSLVWLKRIPISSLPAAQINLTFFQSTTGCTIVGEASPLPPHWIEP